MGTVPTYGVVTLTPWHASTDCQPSLRCFTEITRQRAELLVGYIEADAERCASELGWTYRVGQRDGESFALTEDYSLQRVTVVIADDRVTEITVG
jgi:hypothetical protein